MTQLYTDKVELPNATLYCGDCMDILPTLEKVDCVITDPPYNIGFHYENYHDEMPDDLYYAMFAEIMRIPTILIHYPEGIMAIAMSQNELPDRSVAWIYNSNTGRQWRMISWFGIDPDFDLDNGEYKNPDDKRIKERILNGERARLYDWWEFQQVKNISTEKTNHPCQIPEKLMERIIRITPQAQTICDPFMGSGTTGVAALKLGRKFIGIEIDENYFKIAVDRIAKEANQMKLGFEINMINNGNGKE